MKYLVIDPGHSSGWCLFTANQDSIEIISYGFYEIERSSTYEGDSYLNYEKWLQNKIETTKPEEIIREDYFFSHSFRQGANVNVGYRTVIDLTARRLKLPYHVISPSEWKCWICDHVRPSKIQIQRYGKANAKKWMVQEALYLKYQLRFPNFSLSQKNGKKIKFKHDTVDAVAMAIYFGLKRLQKKNIKVLMECPADIEWGKKIKTFSYQGVGVYQKCEHIFKSGQKEGKKCDRVCFEGVRCKTHTKKEK